MALSHSVPPHTLSLVQLKFADANPADDADAEEDKDGNSTLLSYRHYHYHWVQRLCGLQVHSADASQADDGDAEADMDGQGAVEGVPPYTLKCANSLGDVRLQNCPSPEGQDVLYFTCQWERDGGGMYDVAKLMQPEVVPVCLAFLGRPWASLLCLQLCCISEEQL